MRHNAHSSTGARLFSVALACLLFCLTAGVAPLMAAPREAGEHEAKAAFVYAFAKFVGWPDGAFQGDDPFVIDVMGNAEMLASVRTLRGKLIHGHAIEVRHRRGSDDLEANHLLLCGTEDLLNILATVPQAAHRPVLTVGDDDGFAAAGGVLQLTFVDEHLGFIINRAAARRAGLELSSSVFNLAIRVIDDDGLDPKP